METKGLVLYCDSCFIARAEKVPLVLFIKEVTDWPVSLLTRAELDEQDNLTHKPIPTYECELDQGLVDFKPEFKCPRCKQTCWILNNHCAYNEADEFLYISCLNENSILGWDKPNMKAPPTAIPLPKIKHVRDMEPVEDFEPEYPLIGL